MNDSHAGTTAAKLPMPAPRWPTVSLWLLASLLEAVVLARMAAWTQRTLMVTPLSPLLLGGACGAATAILAYYFGIRVPALLKIGIVLVALMSIVAVHGFFYLDYRQGFSEALAANADPLLRQLAGNDSAVMKQITGHAEPVGFDEFLAAGAQRSVGVFTGWVWWLIDAGLTMVGVAVGASLLARSDRQTTCR